MPQIRPLDREVYLSLLGATGLGREPVFLDTAASTNDWIATRLAEPGAEMFVAAAEEQTAGRGRMGRQWASWPGASLAFSLAWPLPETMKQPGVITLAAGVALAETVEEMAGAGPSLKYPNDLFLSGKKAAGILTEVKSGGGKRFAVIGVGVNVNATEDMFPADLRTVSTSLLIWSGRIMQREAILAGFMNRLEPALELLASGGMKDIMDRYRRLAGAFIGRKVRVNNSGDEIAGVAEGIAWDGALLVRLADGRLHTAHGGEVTFREKE